MRLICAPDSFKETLTAVDAARAMARGAAAAHPSALIDVCPIGDGGEGTMDALIAAMGGEFRAANVIGPLGTPIDCRYGVVTAQKLAVVELAQASGLGLVPLTHRDPARATSFGAGQLIQRAIQWGAETVIVCIGGSATVDGGTAIAQALGATFRDDRDQLIEQPMTGALLQRVARWQPQSTPLPRIRVACDVTNPLLGPHGAAAVYGPQKGATPRQVRQLDEGLAHLARLVSGDPNTPGAGAAGGASFGLMSMCGATLERGIDLVLNAVHFADRCRNASLVMTGEGRLDRQSLHGKACMGVAKAAASQNVPTIAIVGSAGDGADQCLAANGGFLKSFISLADRFGLDRAMNEPTELIARIAAEIAGSMQGSSGVSPA